MSIELHPGRAAPSGRAGRASAAATRSPAAGTPRRGAGTAASAGRALPGRGGFACVRTVYNGEKFIYASVSRKY